MPKATITMPKATITMPSCGNVEQGAPLLRAALSPPSACRQISDESEPHGSLECDRAGRIHRGTNTHLPEHPEDLNEERKSGGGDG